MKLKRNLTFSLLIVSFLPIFLLFQNFSFPRQTYVKGFIDGLVPNNSGTGYLLRGWACQTGVAESIKIQVAFGDKLTASLSATADQPSTIEISAACESSFTRYYFSVPISLVEARRYAGESIYVYGISSDPTINALISRSGMIAMPSVEYAEIPCEDWNGVVDQNIRLVPAGCVIKKQIVFAGPNLSLDCNNAVVDGGQTSFPESTRGQGIGGSSSKAACEDSPLFGTGSRFEDANVSGAVIENCTVKDFNFGVYFNRRVWTKPKAGQVCVALPEVISPVGNLDEYLGGRENRSRFSPHEITLRNVTASSSRNGAVGIFVNEYATNWRIDHSFIKENKGVGIYLERESVGSVVAASAISDNLIGIAIDSSAKNVIERNNIYQNESIGVALYKNCGEGQGVTRYQHSDENIIRNNDIRGVGSAGGNNIETLTTLRFGQARSWNKFGVGIWIASRQGLTTTSMGAQYPSMKDHPCSDSGLTLVGRTVYSDYSQNNIVIGNKVSDHALANIIVEDDGNLIDGNSFSTGSGLETGADVLIGSVMRGLDGDLGPVRNNVIRNNSSSSKVHYGNYVPVFGSTRSSNSIQP